MNHRIVICKLFTQEFILVHSLSTVYQLSNQLLYRFLCHILKGTKHPNVRKILTPYLLLNYKELLKTQLHINHASYEMRVIYFTTLDLIIW